LIKNLTIALGRYLHLMFNFLKNKSIKLEAYTWNNSFIHNFPPTYQDKKNPWFFKTVHAEKIKDPYSGIATQHPTVTTCPGIKDFVSKGVNLCMWQDVIFKVLPNGMVTFTDVESVKDGVQSFAASVHAPAQFGELYKKDRAAVKLNSPWYFHTDEEIDFVFVESHYSTNFFRERGIIIPPGILNFKKQFSTNVHINVPVKEEEYEFTIKAGTPLVTLFPMSESKIDLDVILYSGGLGELGNKLRTLPQLFKNSYQKQK